MKNRIRVVEMEYTYDDLGCIKYKWGNIKNTWDLWGCVNKFNKNSLTMHMLGEGEYEIITRRHNEILSASKLTAVYENKDLRIESIKLMKDKRFMVIKAAVL